MLLLGSCGGDARRPGLQAAGGTDTTGIAFGGETQADASLPGVTVPGSTTAPSVDAGQLAAGKPGLAEPAVADSVMGTVIDLPTALREIAAQETPADVDAEVFAELKVELARLLGDPAVRGIEDKNRNIHAAYDPDAYDSTDQYISEWLAIPWPVNVLGTLRFPVLVRGDYDQNGTVNVTDIVPLARNFGTEITGSSSYYLQRIDYDGNKIINAADLTGIARNFGDHVLAMRFYHSSNLQHFPWIPGEADRITAAEAVPGAALRPGDMKNNPGFDNVLSGLEPSEYYWARAELASGLQQVSWPLRIKPKAHEQYELQLSYKDGELRCMPFLPVDLDWNDVVSVADITGIYLQQYRALAYADAGQEIPDFLDRNQDGHFGHADGVASYADIVNNLSSIGPEYEYRARWTLDPQLVPAPGEETSGLVNYSKMYSTVDYERDKVQRWLVHSLPDLPSGAYLWVENGVIRSEIIQVP
ncbi:hypothetical protein KDL29_07120 [bacterium]|nr:hypothetical protein [bacterium]